MTRCARGYHLSGQYSVFPPATPSLMTWEAAQAASEEQFIRASWRIINSIAQPDRSRRHREATPHPELVNQRPFGLWEGRSADHFTVVCRFRGFPVDEPPETGVEADEGFPPISGVLGPPIAAVTQARRGKDEVVIDTGREDAEPRVTVTATFHRQLAVGVHVLFRAGRYRIQGFEESTGVKFSLTTPSRMRALFWTTATERRRGCGGYTK